MITVVLCRIVDLKVTTHRIACYAQLQPNRPFFSSFSACALAPYVRFPPNRVDSSPAALCPSHHSLSFSLLSFHFSVMLFSRVSRLFLAWVVLCVTQFSHSLCSVLNISISTKGIFRLKRARNFFFLFSESFFFSYIHSQHVALPYIWDFSAFSTLPLSLLTLSHSRPFLMLILDTTPRARVLTDWYILCLPFSLCLLTPEHNMQASDRHARRSLGIRPGSSLGVCLSRRSKRRSFSAAVAAAGRTVLEHSRTRAADGHP